MQRARLYAVAQAWTAVAVGTGKAVYTCDLPPPRVPLPTPTRIGSCLHPSFHVSPPPSLCLAPHLGSPFLFPARSRKDIIRVRKSGSTMTELVKKHMTSPAITVSIRATVQEAADIMLKYGIRRLPVVDTDGGLFWRVGWIEGGREGFPGFQSWCV